MWQGNRVTALINLLFEYFICHFMFAFVAKVIPLYYLWFVHSKNDTGINVFYSYDPVLNSNDTDVILCDRKN